MRKEREEREEEGFSDEPYPNRGKQCSRWRSPMKRCDRRCCDDEVPPARIDLESSELGVAETESEVEVRPEAARRVPEVDEERQREKEQPRSIVRYDDSARLRSRLLQLKDVSTLVLRTIIHLFLEGRGESRFHRLSTRLEGDEEFRYEEKVVDSSFDHSRRANEVYRHRCLMPSEKWERIRESWEELRKELDPVQQVEHLACGRRECLQQFTRDQREFARQAVKETLTVESSSNRSRSTFVDFEGIDDCKEVSSVVDSLEVNESYSRSRSRNCLSR